MPAFTFSDPIGVEYSPYGMDFQTQDSIFKPEETPENKPLYETLVPDEIFLMEPPPPQKETIPNLLPLPEIRSQKPPTRLAHAAVVPSKPNPRKASESTPVLAPASGANLVGSSGGSTGGSTKPTTGEGLKTYGLKEVDEPPRVLQSVKPDYPLKARRMMIEGEVVARFVVGKDGSIEDIQIISATPEGYFERSVIEALKKWKFSPGKYRGQAVKTLVVLPVKFRLKE